MIVLKFGGSCLETPQRIRHACRLMVTAAKERNAVAVVCSAFGGVTNQLINIAHLASQPDRDCHSSLAKLRQRHRSTAHELLEAPTLEKALVEIEALFADLTEALTLIQKNGAVSGADLDHIMGFGERLSTRIISRFLANFLDTAYLDARTIIRTNGQFGHAHVDESTTQSQIRKHFTKDDRLQVVTGFIAQTQDGESTTLGRGGSDYTAALIGAALGCRRIEIWTDVNGFMTADPRLVPHAYAPRSLSFEAAMTLAHFGARVIYPPTLVPAFRADVGVLVKNCFRPQHPGTLIQGSASNATRPIAGLSTLGTIAQVRLTPKNGCHLATIASKLFALLAHEDAQIILISQGFADCTVYLDRQHPSWCRVQAMLTETFHSGADAELTIQTHFAILALVGSGLTSSLKAIQQATAILENTEIVVHAVGQTHREIDLCMVIDSKHQIQALQLLHQSFFEVAPQIAGDTHSMTLVSD